MKRVFNLIMLTIAYECCYSQQLAWLKLPDFPGGERHSPSSFSINGKGYMGLGLDSNAQYKNDWYEYDPFTNSWTQKASLPSIGRRLCTNFVVDTLGYVIAGEKSTGALGEVWQYNPSSDLWVQKNGLSGPARENGSGFVTGGKIYYGTGYVGGNNRVDFYEYDPITDSWVQKANMPGGLRAAGMGFSIGAKGYMGMGHFTNATSYYTDFYEYDPANNTWTQKADYPMWNQGACSYASALSGYILCGNFLQYEGIRYNPLNLLYRYNPGTNGWYLEGSFPGLPRGHAGGFSINRDMYIGAGSQSVDGLHRMIPGETDLLKDFWKLSYIIDSIALSTDHNNGGEFKDSKIKIFPNPSGDYLNIAQEVLISLTRIRIYTVDGKLAEELVITGSNEKLDISKLSSGTYFVELVTKHKELLGSKFIKK